MAQSISRMAYWQDLAGRQLSCQVSVSEREMPAQVQARRKL